VIYLLKNNKWATLCTSFHECSTAVVAADSTHCLPSGRMTTVCSFYSTSAPL